MRCMTSLSTSCCDWTLRKKYGRHRNINKLYYKYISSFDPWQRCWYYISLIKYRSICQPTVKPTLESSCRRPRDSWWGCGREEMGQPLVRVQLRRTQRPPRLHTALQLGSKQQDSQHVAPPLPSARGCQPRLMTLLQWIPSTPPVTRHRSADTPGGREEVVNNDTLH